MTEMTDAEFSDSECLRGSAEMHMAEARRVDESDHPLADMIAKAHRMRADRLEALAKRLETGVIVPRTPTTAMVEAGAQRLASWDDGCKWPDSWSSLQASQIRRDAQKVYHAMLQAQEEQG